MIVKTSPMVCFYLFQIIPDEVVDDDVRDPEVLDDVGRDVDLAPGPVRAVVGGPIRGEDCGHVTGSPPITAHLSLRTIRCSPHLMLYPSRTLSS